MRMPMLQYESDGSRMEKMREIDGNIEIVRYDGIGSSTVYLGGLSYLIKAELKWRTIDEDGLKFDILTLSEIVEQLGSNQIITIINEKPLSGSVWQYGNYSDGSWREIGKLEGYA